MTTEEYRKQIEDIKEEYRYEKQKEYQDYNMCMLMFGLSDYYKENLLDFITHLLRLEQRIFINRGRGYAYTQRDTDTVTRYIIDCVGLKYFDTVMELLNLSRAIPYEHLSRQSIDIRWNIIKNKFYIIDKDTVKSILEKKETKYSRRENNDIR